jgi:flavin-dependent dehydrogenase
MIYDVIIIGAGLAGCSAARELAVSGYNVLLVERFKLPRDKSCSGILIKKSMELVRRYFGEDTPESVMCTLHDNRGMIITDDKGQEYRFEQQGLNIWRKPFDYWLAQKAVESGAELRDSTIAMSCEEQDDSVIVNFQGASSYAERAKLVVVCDGAAGSLKRQITHKPQNFITTYQTFNKGSIDLDHHYFYAWLQPHLSEYDAWFNVKDDYLIFGVAVKDTRKLEHYYAEFISYMQKHHKAKIEKQEKAERWLMPQIMPGCPIEYGHSRVLFAGETAGFLNPMGEGISSGLESGYAAAKAIEGIDLSGYLDLKTLHLLYQDYTSELIDYMQRQWSIVANLSGTFRHMSCR